MYKVCLENAIITGLVISNKKVHAQHTPHAIQSVKEVYPNYISYILSAKFIDISIYIKREL